MVRHRAVSGLLAWLVCSWSWAATPGQGYFGIGWKHEILGGVALGMRVVSVTSGSPANTAGVSPGDLILSINGVAPTPSMSEAEDHQFWAQFRNGDRVVVKLQRGDKTFQLPLSLSELPKKVAADQAKRLAAEQCALDARAASDRAAARPSTPDEWLLTPEWKQVMQLIRKQPESTAVITLIGGEPPRIELGVPSGTPAGLRLAHLPPSMANEARSLTSGEKRRYLIRMDAPGLGFSIKVLPQ